MSGLRRIRSMLEFQEVDKDQGVERNYLYYKDSSHHYHTEKQEVNIIESATWGTMLFLDGILQSTTQDEVIYHNALVHPLMSLLPSHATHTLIVGGGEGATAREVLRYTHIKSVTMIDYDKELIEIMKQKGAQWSQGAWDDPRLRVICEDAWKQIPQEESHDAAIIDLTDPDPLREDWLGLLRHVFQNVSTVGGPIAMNCGLYMPWATQNLQRLQGFFNILCKEYPGYSYQFYTAMVPSFNSPWTFAILSKTNTISFGVIPPWIKHLIRSLPLEFLETPVDTNPCTAPL